MSEAFREIIRRAREGEREAIDTLLRPHLPQLTAFVRTRIGGAHWKRESSADVVQSVCRDALQHLDDVRAVDETGFRAWLFKIAGNKIFKKVDFHQAALRDVRRERETPFDSRVDDGLLLNGFAGLASPSRDAEAREELERIEEALGSLPEDWRQVLAEICIAGTSYAECALSMDRSEDAVRQLLHRARARLATLLSKR